MVIIKEKYGQLGNRLWQFAYLIAFGLENNITISYPGFDDYAKYFQFTKKNIFCSLPGIYSPALIPDKVRSLIFESVPLLKRILLRLDKNKSIYNHIWVRRDEYFDMDNIDNVKKITGKKIITLEGWLTRCNESLLKHSSEVKKLLHPIGEHKGVVDDLHSKLRKKYDVIVGFHIRKDLEVYEKPRMLTFKEYQILMKNTFTFFNNKKVAFIICSDRELKVERAYFDEYPCYYSTGHFIEDNYSLSKCDYIVVGISSTYSLWASFFGDVPILSVPKCPTPLAKSILKMQSSNFGICKTLI